MTATVFAFDAFRKVDFFPMPPGQTKVPRLVLVLLVVGAAAAYYYYHRASAASAYVGRLNDPDPAVRYQAADALVQIGSPAVPALVAALQEGGVRPAVMDILHQIGPDARNALAAVSAIAQDTNHPLRGRAIGVLGTIGAAESVPLLIEALEDEDPSVGTKAVIALGRIGPVDEQVVPALAGVLADEALRPSALSAIGQFGADAAQAVPSLITALGHSDARADSTRIAWALGQIGPSAKAAVPALIDALTDNDYLFRAQAAASLGSIGPDAKDAVPLLIGAVTSQPGGGRGLAADWAVPRSATKALGQIGPAAKDAIPVLTDALEHRDEDVREYAGISLQQIEPRSSSTAGD